MSLASGRLAPETGTLAITLRLGATGAALWRREPSVAANCSRSLGKAFDRSSRLKRPVKAAGRFIDNPAPTPPIKIKKNDCCEMDPKQNQRTRAVCTYNL